MKREGQKEEVRILVLLPNVPYTLHARGTNNRECLSNIWLEERVLLLKTIYYYFKYRMHFL